MTVPSHQQLLDEVEPIFKREYNEDADALDEHRDAELYMQWTAMLDWTARQWAASAVQSLFGLKAEFKPEEPPTDASNTVLWETVDYYTDAYESILHGHPLRLDWGHHLGPTAEGPTTVTHDQWEAADRANRKTIESGIDNTTAQICVNDLLLWSSMVDTAISTFAASLSKSDDEERSPDFLKEIWKFGWKKAVGKATEEIGKVTASIAPLVVEVIQTLGEAAEKADKALTTDRAIEFAQDQSDRLQDYRVAISEYQSSFLTWVATTCQEAIAYPEVADYQQAYREMHEGLQQLAPALKAEVVAARDSLPTELATTFLDQARQVDRGWFGLTDRPAYVELYVNWWHGQSPELQKATFRGDKAEQVAEVLRERNEQGLDVWALPIDRHIFLGPNPDVAGPALWVSEDGRLSPADGTDQLAASHEELGNVLLTAKGWAVTTNLTGKP